MHRSTKETAETDVCIIQQRTWKKPIRTLLSFVDQHAHGRKGERSFFSVCLLIGFEFTLDIPKHLPNNIISTLKAMLLSDFKCILSCFKINSLFLRSKFAGMINFGVLSLNNSDAQYFWG